MKMFFLPLLVLAFTAISPSHPYAKIEVGVNAATLQATAGNIAIDSKGATPDAGTKEDVPADQKGPTFIIDKISFKNINPEVEGFSIECHGLESKDSGVPVLVGFTAYKTYFSQNPSRRISSELTNLSIKSILNDTYKAQKKGISTAILWRCHTTAITDKGAGYTPFNTSESSCYSCLKSNSVPILKGNF